MILHKVNRMILSLWFIVILFLYTYSTEVNSGTLYSRQATLLLYLTLIIYIAISIGLNKKIIAQINNFDLGVILLGSYIILNTLVYSNSFTTNLNLAFMVLLMYLFFKIVQIKVRYNGTNEIHKIYNFIMNTFILFMLLSTIVALLISLDTFNLFPVPNISLYNNRAQSWFNNSTIYGVNLSIGIMFLIYKFIINKNMVNFILIPWFLYWLFQSGGRTGIVTSSVGLIVFIITYYEKSLLKGFLFLISLVYTFYITLFDYLLENFHVFRRFFEGNIGYRDVLFQQVYSIWEKQNIINQFFGLGTYSLMNKYNFSAHSGFLLLWFEYGVIFLIIYTIFIASVLLKYLSVIKNTKTENKSLLILGLALSTMFIVAELSVNITVSTRYGFSLIILFAALPY